MIRPNGLFPAWCVLVLAGASLGAAPNDLPLGVSRVLWDVSVPPAYTLAQRNGVAMAFGKH